MLRISLCLTAGILLNSYLCAKSVESDALEGRIQNQIKNHEYVDTLNSISLHYLKTDPSRSLQFINLALNIADSLKYDQGLFRATLNKGNSYWVSGLFDLALNYYYKALTIEIDQYPEGLAIVNNNIGEVFKKRKQFDSAMIHYQKAWGIVHGRMKNRYPSLLAANIAELHLLEGKHDSAEYYYRIALKYGKTGKDDRGLSYALFGFGELSYLKDDLEQSIDYHRQSLAIRETIKDNRAIIQSYLKLGKYYNENGDTRQSLHCIEMAEMISKQMSAMDLLCDSYLAKSNHFAEGNNFKQANQYLKKFYLMKDSLESAMFIVNLEKVKESLKADLVNAENKLLNEQRIQQNQSIKSQIVTITIISFLTMVLGLSLTQYYKKLKLTKKSALKLDQLNKVITDQNREINKINSQLDTRLDSSNKMLVESQRISKLGSWEYDLNTARMVWSQETFRQLCIEPDILEPSVKMARKFLNKANYYKLLRAFARVKVIGNSEQLELTISDSKKCKKTISLEMVPEIKEDKVLKVYGSNLDITKKVIDRSREKSIIKSLLELSMEANLVELSFEQFIKGVLLKSTNTLEVDRASFWFYSKSDNLLNCLNRYERSTNRFTKDKSINTNNFPVYFQSLLSNRSLAIEDASSDHITSEFAEDYLSQNNIHAMLDAKIVVDGKFVGIISFERTKKPYKWDFSEQRFVGSLSDIISMAIAINNKKKLEEQKLSLIEKLTKKNQSLEDFAYVISHNLRGPVTQIMGLSNLLLDDQKGPELVSDISSRLSVASHNLDQVISDLNQVLKYNDDQKGNEEEFTLSEVVDMVSNSLSSELGKVDHKLEMTFDKSFKIHSSRTVFYNLIYNLLSNSIKYRNQDRPMIFSIGVIEESDRIILEFKDNGKGIDLHRYGRKIFKMYQRFDLTTEGRGIGLYLVKNQIEMLGGQIQLESAIGQGTDIKVIIPRASSVLHEKNTDQLSMKSYT